MSHRNSRPVRPMLIPGALLAICLVGVATVLWRAHHRGGLSAGDGVVARSLDELMLGPTRLDDPRLRWLRDAVGHWQQSLAGTRVVVDQVCLVPDVPAFLDAISLWDERHFFPVLIDDPTWVLPFLRAFRPARVVRYDGKRDRHRNDSESDGLDPARNSKQSGCAR